MKTTTISRSAAAASMERRRHERDEDRCRYVTQRFDRERTGWNPREARLNVDNVSERFGPLLTLDVSGEVFAQPLYVDGVEAHHRRHDILFVATAENWVYAFDTETFAPIWPPRRLTPSGCLPYLSDMAYHGLGYNDFSPGRTVGIIGTPVIDPERHVAYLVTTFQTVPYAPGQAAPPGAVQHWLHAIDLRSGKDVAGTSPQQISASVGATTFDSRVQMQRPGLLLLNDRLYIGFGSYGDNTNIAPYYGWVLIYEARLLEQLAIFLTSSQGGGSIWHSGTGVAADAKASVYFATGNGPFGPVSPPGSQARSDYGDSVLRLEPHWSGGTPTDYFTPFNQAQLNSGDLDQASGGVLVVPGDFQGTEVLVQVGKAGTIYVLDRKGLGGFQGPLGPDQVVQSTPLPGSSGEKFYGCPAYYKTSAGNRMVYLGGMSLPIIGYQFDHTAHLSSVSQTGDVFPGYGTIPVVSSHRSHAGTGVLWSIQNTMDGVNSLRLKAYDAENLATRLVDLPCGTWPKQGSFLVPTVAEGKVYVGSDGQVQVFGLTGDDE